MTLHNAKGLEYPTVFIAGCEDGVFPHSRALDEGAPRGGAPALLRGHHQGDARALPHLRAPADAVFGARTYGMPSRFLDELPADLLDEHEETSAGSGERVGGRTRWRVIPCRRPPCQAAALAHPGPPAELAAAPPGAQATRHRAPAFRLGEDVLHAAFGEGVVTGVEAGGRDRRALRSDGSERKLMAEYAPVSRRCRPLLGLQPIASAS